MEFPMEVRITDEFKSHSHPLNEAAGYEWLLDKRKVLWQRQRGLGRFP